MKTKTNVRAGIREGGKTVGAGVVTNPPPPTTK
jgi:hypothetical protein